MIKLIAIDLDGTLLTDAKTISDTNKKILAEAKARGVKIVICTGRPLVAIKDYLAELNLLDANDYSITFNGGLIQTNTGEILGKSAMPLADVKDIYQLLTKLDLPMDVLSDALCFQFETAADYPSIYPRLNKALTFVPKTIDALEEDTLYNKVVAAIDAEYLDQQIALIPTEAYERFEIFKTRPNLLEFMPKGVTKAFGLSVLGKHLGIETHEMMALGDEANDLSMIDYAGMGVAMGNATDGVKVAANFITGTNQADGVAYAIQKFVFDELN
ncbi:Cof-type HAD-IIB family hydrolase [Enterococcus xiangfangensis]|uniref:Cof-type HAD-IIB family hydrolase n=1 Tax=Enterococcus xiangfangensis TaxID=1296537 RepID=A0ABU3FBC3_9ENTE|nr:Cof-type HAD-IIB family hydrolase [Enterococcus xiangfangensis]MBM7711879.1 Cof subfamily protein (haloacid dehalogenase superfamily) [Enterococcus xiangfangensis]MDT2759953.1 Cof-type HAD-IIB family hydrolase [Enterococcus xiangfangensis]NBK08154.1 HAD family phosphatase [Enterococcus asini]